MFRFKNGIVNGVNAVKRRLISGKEFNLSHPNEKFIKLINNSDENFSRYSQRGFIRVFDKERITFHNEKDFDDLTIGNDDFTHYSQVIIPDNANVDLCTSGNVDKYQSDLVAIIGCKYLYDDYEYMLNMLKDNPEKIVNIKNPSFLLCSECMSICKSQNVFDKIDKSDFSLGQIKILESYVTESHVTESSITDIV